MNRFLRVSLVAVVLAASAAPATAKAPATPPPATCPRVPIEFLDAVTTAHLRPGDVVHFVVLPTLPPGSPANAPLTAASPESPRGTLHVSAMTGKRTSNRSASVTFAVDPFTVGETPVQLTAEDGTPYLRVYGARNGIPSLYTYLPYVGTPASVYDMFHRGKEVAYAAGTTFFLYDRSADARTCLDLPKPPPGPPGLPAVPPGVSVTSGASG